MLGELPVPGRPSIVDYGRAKAYCVFSRCEWDCFGILFSFFLEDGPI